MSEAQHTPGPWRAIKFDECQTSIVAELEPKRHPLVAIVSVGEGRPDGEANVALILAAPQLLAENAKLRDERDRLANCLSEMVKLVDDFMPNVGRCTIQNYRRLNDAPIEARRLLAALAPAGQRWTRRKEA